VNQPVRKSVTVKCSPDHAFLVFTDRLDVWWPRSHRRFDTSTMTLEGRVGGRVFERSDSDSINTLGEVLRWDPPRGVSYTWMPGSIDAPTRVDVTFTARGNTTVVDVVHSPADSGLGDKWPDRAAIFSASWDSVFESFSMFAAVHESQEEK
jgi:uncharacterized protein YndB with AHSA1/START domain